MEINFTTQTWKEGKMYVSYCPELDVSSCGKTVEEAKWNLLEAVEGFLEETKKMGTLKEILRESGFVRGGQKKWRAPEWVSLEREKVLIP
ncbi:type II toxin-antitoxin system HicB family antitoxin [Patescibacteria group bacterium]|nr:type II toxin-antitoxin system HicB family antitoxin [Patescibacteria group bacterium]MBU4481270.1 type II toxin-antitoxin system HicB family antitoxin [Patescibacteria group bacterium]